MLVGDDRGDAGHSDHCQRRSDPDQPVSHGAAPRRARSRLLAGHGAAPRRARRGSSPGTARLLAGHGDTRDGEGARHRLELLGCDTWLTADDRFRCCTTHGCQSRNVSSRLPPSAAATASSSAPARTARCSWIGCHRSSHLASADMHASSARSSDAERFSGIGHESRSAHRDASSKAPRSSAPLEGDGFVSVRCRVHAVVDLDCHGLPLSRPREPRGARYGSQRMQTPPDCPRRLQGVVADERLPGRLPRIRPDRPFVTGGQGVAGSNPAVPTAQRHF